MVVRQRKRCGIKVEVRCGEALHMEVRRRASALAECGENTAEAQSMLCIICEYANQRKVLILRIFLIGLCIWADYSIVKPSL